MILYAGSIFLSAFLLFQVQPLIARVILPWFGGSAAVWTTCMLFFQVLLLGGYAYAHALNAKLRGRGQAIVHTLLLAAAVACLPIAPAESWKPAGGDEPVSRILLLLGATVGLPYFLLAATSPRSEEHTSELQSRLHLVCRLLLEKKKKKTKNEVE